MAGKISDEQLFEAEKRLKRSETIIAAMSDDERNFPDLLVQQGGKKELVLAANQRRIELAKKSGFDIKEVGAFLISLKRTSNFITMLD